MIKLRSHFIALAAAVWLAQSQATQAIGKGLLPGTEVAGRAADSSLMLTVNPYSNVVWATDGQFRANLHTHSTNSDGSYPPAEVIDRYQAAGYGALAITDHDRATWPWSAYGRNPQQVGLVAIAGDELSNDHHALSLFTAYEPHAYTLDQALTRIDGQGGLAALCHPSFHWSILFSAPGARNPMTETLRKVTQGDFTIETGFRTTRTGRGILMGNYSYENPVALNLELLPDNTVRVLLMPPADQGAILDLRSRLANDWGINTRDGQWHRVAATRVGDVVSLYLDGRFMKWATNVTQAFDLQGSFFYVGRDNRTQGLELDGDLDWPRLWNRGLSSNEVFSLWQRALPGQDGGPARDGIVFEFDSQSTPVPTNVRNYYADLFSRHPRLFGIEIVNPSSDFSLDRKLWDLLLTRLMPQRPVWGLANDDMHHEVHLGVGWSVLLAPQLDEASAKQALQNGTYYFSTIRRGGGSEPDRAKTPRIGNRA